MFGCWLIDGYSSDATVDKCRSETLDVVFLLNRDVHRCC